MIVFQQETELRLVTHPDHARAASEMLALWRADGLPEHPRRTDLLFAVREHDNGWRETDAAPRIDLVEGRPCSFLDLPDGPRRDLWKRGTARYARDHPYPTLLMIRHAFEIHRHQSSAQAWADFLTALRVRDDELMEELGADPSEVEADYRWLRLADGLSLRACGALTDVFEDGSTRIERNGRELSIDPFPLAGATTFSIPCRTIPDRRYRSDVDLAVELASAHWTDFKIRLVPA